MNLLICRIFFAALQCLLSFLDMSICPYGMKQLRNHWTGFHCIWYWRVLIKKCWAMSVFIYFRKDQQSLYLKTYTHFCVYFKHNLLNYWGYVSNRSSRGTELHILCSVHFLHKTWWFWNNWTKGMLWVYFLICLFNNQPWCPEHRKKEKALIEFWLC
jgi:hypothetical protein